MNIRPTTQRRAGGQAGIAYVVGRARPHPARHLVNHWPPIALRGRHQWPAADRIKRQRGPITFARHVLPVVVRISSAFPRAAGADRLRIAPSAQNFPARDLEFGDQIAGGIAEGLPVIGSLRHALSFRRSHVQEVRQVTQGVGYVVTS